MALSKKQKSFLKAKHSRINILSGSVRSGKTFVLGLLLFKLAIHGPKGKGAVIAKTLETLRENILDPLVERFPGAISYTDHGRRIVVGNKRIRGVGANDEKSKSKIQGDTLAWGIGDEVALWPHSFFAVLLDRLSVPGAKFFGSLNPEGPFHWLKTEYLDRPEVDTKEFRFFLDDNPALTEDYKESIRNENTGFRRLRNVLGEWALAEGLVYDMFRHELHVKEMDVSKYQKQFIGVDYGTTNPCVFLHGHYDLDGNIYFDKEYFYDSKKHEKQKTNSQYADDMARFISNNGISLNVPIYCDPSATSFILELRQKGFKAIPAVNDVKPGIDTVSKKLAKNQIIYSPAVENLIKEKGIYSWDDKAQAKGKDEPKKVFDHACDAERYPVHTLFGGNSEIFIG